MTKRRRELLVHLNMQETNCTQNILHATHSVVPAAVGLRAKAIYHKHYLFPRMQICFNSAVTTYSSSCYNSFPVRSSKGERTFQSLVCPHNLSIKHWGQIRRRAHPHSKIRREKVPKICNELEVSITNFSLKCATYKARGSKKHQGKRWWTTRLRKGQKDIQHQQIWSLWKRKTATEVY